MLVFSEITTFKILKTIYIKEAQHKKENTLIQFFIGKNQLKKKICTMFLIPEMVSR